MQAISVFFKKFSLLISKEEDQKEKLLQLIHNRFLISLKKNHVSIKNGIVFVRAHPTIRQKIISHKKSLIAELGEKGVSVWNIT